MNEPIKQFRQGDVFLEYITALPPGLKRKKREGGKIILARGEATGHHHYISARGVESWVDDAGVTYLEVKEAVTLLQHQEHGSVELVPGFIRCPIQREYAPEAPRRVAD